MIAHRLLIILHFLGYVTIALSLKHVFKFFYQRLVNDTKTLNKNLGIEGADELLENARDALDRTNENMRVSSLVFFLIYKKAVL